MRAVNGSRAGALGAALVAFLAGGLLLGTPAAAATGGSGGSITLTPDHGLPGSAVKVTLTCGSWDEGWDIALDGLGSKRNDVHIGSDVRFSTSLSVPPDAPPGPASIVATCTATVATPPAPDIGNPDLNNPDRTAPAPTPPDPITLTATFTVDAPPATIVPRPDRGAAGAVVRITGDHLRACDRAGWTVVIGGSIQAPKVDDPVGAPAVFTVVVPAAAAVGPTEVALDCGGKPVATAAFRVTAAASPTSATKPPVQPPAKQPPQADAAQPVTVVVPDLTGLTLAQAASALSDRQLALAAGGAPDLGVVTGQGPAAGTQVAPGTAVSVQQSAPAVTVSGSLTLPLTGLSVLALAAAAAVLRAQRTKAGRAWARRNVRVVVGAAARRSTRGRR